MPIASQVLEGIQCSSKTGVCASTQAFSQNTPEGPEQSTSSNGWTMGKSQQNTNRATYIVATVSVD